KKELQIKQPNVFRKSFERKNISYSVLNEEDKMRKLLDIAHGVKGSGIVYVRSRKETGEIARFLNNNKISADLYHAGLHIDERSKKQDNWISNRTRVIVATNAFG